MTRRILLITKLKMSNVGNQAITSELVCLVKERYADIDLHVVGRPKGLKRYMPVYLAGAGNRAPIVFEKWAGRIASAPGKEPVRGIWKPGRDMTCPVLRVRKYEDDAESSAARRRNGLSTLGRWLVAMWKNRSSAFDRPYGERLGLLREADMVVYNGAGELIDNRVAVRQLLELRVAQKLGKRVVPINQTVEVTDPNLVRLLQVVYGECPRIIVRGARSADLLVRAGVSARVIEVAPDIAFLTPAPSPSACDTAARREDIGPRTIGISIPAHAPGDVGLWREMIGRLAVEGWDILFVSNDMWVDRPVWSELSRTTPIRPIHRTYGYVDYQGLLARLSCVVSGRLHTNILAVTAGTPVIPLECRTHKNTEVFEYGDGYPVAPVSMRVPGWDRTVVENVAGVFVSRVEIVSQMNDWLSAVRRGAVRQLNWPLDD